MISAINESILLMHNVSRKQHFLKDAQKTTYCTCRLWNLLKGIQTGQYQGWWSSLGKTFDEGPPQCYIKWDFVPPPLVSSDLPPYLQG